MPVLVVDYTHLSVYELKYPNYFIGTNPNSYLHPKFRLLRIACAFDVPLFVQPLNQSAGLGFAGPAGQHHFRVGLDLAGCGWADGLDHGLDGVDGALECGGHGWVGSLLLEKIGVYPNALMTSADNCSGFKVVQICSKISTASLTS